MLQTAFHIHATGVSVIRQEAAGLDQLAASLDESFSAAVKHIVTAQGRVVVSGMGKSGHVCRKIAATLSATGSPALFLHPAEASHGDLGMLKADDVLIALSNSGATPELRPLLAYARRIAVPVIAISTEPDSALMRDATVRITLPRMPEACPERIAPTTSTTMMLALGDALAVAAMQARGIKRDELIQWHPGGRIGSNAMAVDTLVRSEDPLPLVTPAAGIRDVVIEMTSIGKGIAGVVDEDGALIGAITDGDLRRAFDRMLIATACEIMTRNPRTVPSGTTVGDARRLMNEAKITAVFVMSADDPRKPLALLHIHDLATAA